MVRIVSLADLSVDLPFDLADGCVYTETPEYRERKREEEAAMATYLSVPVEPVQGEPLI